MRGAHSRVVVAALAVGLACLLPHDAGARRAKGLCATAARKHSAPPYLAVVSALPAELAPLVAATDIEKTIEVDGRPYYVGRLGRVSVMLGLTRIGMFNATATARSLVANPNVAGIIMSGTAGTSHRLGDVVIASDWVGRDGAPVYHANAALLALGERAESSLPALQNCTLVPPRSPTARTVCLAYVPGLFFGTIGFSEGFEDGPAGCIAGDEVYGCDLPSPMLASTSGAGIRPAQVVADVEDEESAAVAGVAEGAGVPFLAVRAASDCGITNVEAAAQCGALDPIGDGSFPGAFNRYYKLASANAATVTEAVVAEVGKLARRRSERGTCRQLAKAKWDAAAARIRARSPH